MRFRFLSLFLVLFLFIIMGCGDSSDEADDGTINAQSGEIFGVVTNKETGMPIKGATVKIGTQSAVTDDDGRYSIKEIPFSDNIVFTATAPEYKDYLGSVSLEEKLKALNIEITPTQSPSAPILAVLDEISNGIESLDDKRIPEIQSHFSEEYIAGKDEATTAGVFAGVVPPDYISIPFTLGNINRKYSKLKFQFANPEIKLFDDTADITMRFTVDAETNPPNPAQWLIVVDGKMTFVNQDGEWKMVFWGLIPPFLKFEENPI